MSLDQAYLMLEHSNRSEKRMMELLKIYQEALGLIATNSALHPHLLAQAAIRKALPIMKESEADPWPPLSAQNQSAN